jgi:hypothetical protein
MARPAQAGRSHGAFHEAVEPVHNTPGFYKMSVTAHFMNPMNLFTTRVGGGEIVAPFFRYRSHESSLAGS